MSVWHEIHLLLLLDDATSSKHTDVLFYLLITFDVFLLLLSEMVPGGHWSCPHCLLSSSI